MRWDEGLTGRSLEVASVASRYLRVMAGPGTGKTFAMIRRIARLLQEGVPAEAILAVTFTRTAAADLAAELSRLDVPEAKEVRATTLHAFGFSVLGRSKVFEQIERVPRPVLEFEERFLLADLSERTGKNVTECEKRLKAFSAAWARLQSEEPGWPSEPADKELERWLKRWLKFHRAMLLGELVTETWRYLRDNPAADDFPSFSHILIDEYQDLNRAEQELIEVIATNASSTTIVGDQDQSIYSFKHAHPEGIREYNTTHPGTNQLDLEECRRCPKKVVRMAAVLIAENEDSAENSRQLRVYANNPEGEVHLVQWASLEKEAEGLAKYIALRVQAGDVAPGCVLVLAGRKQIGLKIRDALKAALIPAESFFNDDALPGNPKQRDECAAPEAFSLLTLLAEPEDRVALRCWCGMGSSTLQSRGWKEIWDHAAAAGRSPREVLEDLSAGRLRLSYTKNVVERYRALQARLLALAPLTSTSLLDAIFPATAEWAQDLRRLANELDAPDYKAPHLLKCLRTSVTQPKLPPDPDYVRVMSLHKSKGLTADMVVVAGCVDGVIPAIDTKLSPAEQAARLREQRRLFYVAITRPRQILVLSNATEADLATARAMHVQLQNVGNVVPLRASRFIRELGSAAPRTILGSQLLQQIAGPPAPNVGPRPSQPPIAQSVTISGGNVQIGNGNVQVISAASHRVGTPAIPVDPAKQVRFGIVTALPKEFAAMQVMLDDVEDYPIDKSIDPNDYIIGSIKAADGVHRVVVTLLKKMGNNSAASAATHLIRSFPIVSNVLMVGIAGGLPNPTKPASHVRLGDIVVSSEHGVVQYDNVKLQNGVAEVRDTSSAPSALLVGKVKKLEANRLLGQRPWETWLPRGSRVADAARPSADHDQLFRDVDGKPVVVPHPADPARVDGTPRVHLGRIASANTLLKDASYRDTLLQDHDARAAEMEGSGIADGTWDAGRWYLLVRGICDYCDTHKNDVWQGYAAVAAASYARALLSSITLREMGL